MAPDSTAFATAPAALANLERSSRRCCWRLSDSKFSGSKKSNARIRPVLEIPIQLSAGLTAVDLRHDEEMPPKPEAQDTQHVDRMIRRQEVLTAQSDAKTVADCAMEVSYVMQLSQALLEAGDIIEETTTARHKYLDVQREHEETMEQQGGSKRRATGTTRTIAPAPAVLSTIATFFFPRLPNGQYGPVSQLSRSEKCCTGPFNWGEAHRAGENVKRRTGPFLRKSPKNQTRTTTRQRGAARHGNQEPPGQAPRCTGRKQQPKHAGDFTDRSRHALTYIEMP